MRALQVTQYVSSPLDLHPTALPTPQPHPSKYLIAIHAAGTNFFDLLQIRGKYQHQPPLPWIAGAEFAGTILAVPTTSSSSPPRYHVGDWVFGAHQGAYATHILAPEAVLLPVPAGWSFEDAAGLYVTAPTAYGALVVRAQARRGEWVLVHAGAGGVGLSAVQVAKALGCTVVATAGTEAKREVCRRFGADWVVDYSGEGWAKEVVELCRRERTGNGQVGVDVVFDPVGMVDQSLRCVAWNARLVVIGFAAGNIEKVAMNRVLLKNVSLVGLHWGQYAKFEPETVHTVWKGIFDLIAAGKFKGICFTDQKYDGLESIPTALKALGDRETWGKVVVSIDEKQEAQSKL